MSGDRNSLSMTHFIDIKMGSFRGVMRIVVMIINIYDNYRLHLKHKKVELSLFNKEYRAGVFQG